MFDFDCGSRDKATLPQLDRIGESIAHLAAKVASIEDRSLFVQGRLDTMAKQIQADLAGQAHFTEEQLAKLSTRCDAELSKFSQKIHEFAGNGLAEQEPLVAKEVMRQLQPLEEKQEERTSILFQRLESRLDNLQLLFDSISRHGIDHTSEKDPSHDPLQPLTTESQGDLVVREAPLEQLGKTLEDVQAEVLTIKQDLGDIARSDRNKELEAQQSQLQMLEVQVQKLVDEQQTTVGLVEDKGTQDVTLPASSEYRESCSFHDWCFQAGVWDAALLIGTETFGATYSIYMALVFMLNAWMQVTFAYLIRDNFTFSNYDEDYQKGLKDFRIRIGHAFGQVDQVSYQSLMGRICHLDPSVHLGAKQFADVEVIDKYLTPNPLVNKDDIPPPGPVMCSLSCALWVFVIVKEFRAIWEMYSAFVGLWLSRPMLVDKRSTIITYENDQWCLERISLLRLCIVTIVFAFRTWNAAFLLSSGIQFLVHTIDMQELLLNAIALECILLLDQSMFEALAPIRVKRVLRSIRPLPLPKRMVWKHFDLSTVGGLIIVTIVMAGSVPSLIEDEITTLRKVNETLCGGHLDFAYSPVSFSPYVYWSRTSQTGQHDPFLEGVVSAVARPHEADDEFANYSRLLEAPTLFFSTWSVEASAKWTLEKANTMTNPNCHDTIEPVISGDDEFPRMNRVSASMRFPHDVNECADLVEYCNHDTFFGRVARSICPLSCGCSLPNSSLVLTSAEGGCPAGCSRTREFMDVYETAPCSEKTVQELKDDAAWKQYADTLVDIANNSYWPSTFYAMATFFRDSMYELGCNVATSPELLDMGWAPCSEEHVRTFPFKSLRLLCPLSCACTATMVNCPKSCGMNKLAAIITKSTASGNVSAALEGLGR